MTKVTDFDQLAAVIGTIVARNNLKTRRPSVIITVDTFEDKWAVAAALKRDLEFPSDFTMQGDDTFLIRGVTIKLKAVEEWQKLYR